MPIVDYAALPEFPMRAGITGKWIAGHEHGSTALSVLGPVDGPALANRLGLAARFLVRHDTHLEERRSAAFNRLLH